MDFVIKKLENIFKKLVIPINKPISSKLKLIDWYNQTGIYTVIRQTRVKTMEYNSMIL